MCFIKEVIHPIFNEAEMASIMSQFDIILLFVFINVYLIIVDRNMYVSIEKFCLIYGIKK